MLFLFVLRHMCRYIHEIVICLCGAALFFLFICKAYVDLRSATCFGIQLHSFCFPVLKSSLFLKGFCLTLSIVSLYMLNVFCFFLFLLFCTYFYHPYLVILASPPPPPPLLLLLLRRRRRQPRLSWSRHSVACVAGDTADYCACTHVYEGKPPQTQNLTQLFAEFSSVSNAPFSSISYIALTSLD